MQIQNFFRHYFNLYSCLKWCFCFYLRGSWQKSMSNVTLLKLLPKSLKIMPRNWMPTITATLLMVLWNPLKKALNIFLNLCVSFLDNLFVEKEKYVPFVSIGQAIMFQVKPKTLIAPLQLGLRIHQHFGSSFLIDSLNKHSFCGSYSKVLNYGRWAARHQGTKISGVSESSSAEPTVIHSMGMLCHTCSFLVLRHTTFRWCTNRRSY